jgi:hypothetical protein
MAVNKDFVKVDFFIITLLDGDRNGFVTGQLINRQGSVTVLADGSVTLHPITDAAAIFTDWHRDAAPRMRVFVSRHPRPDYRTMTTGGPTTIAGGPTTTSA